MNVKQLILVLVCFLYASDGFSQRSNVWVFGGGAGLDFNSGVPIPIETHIDGFGEGCASVCDENGRLLFYTEGSKVWDRNGDLMNNGTGLTPVTSTNGVSPTSSTSQGALIVPFINDKSKYFIFSLTSYEQGVHYGELYYSVVDMQLNNGKGDVVAGRKGVFVDSALTEQMTAIVGDRCNIWLLVCSRKPEHKIKAFEITEQGINFQPIVSSGFPSYSEQFFAGKFAIAPNRKVIALTKNVNAGVGREGLALFDFEPATGVVDHYRQLSPDEGGNGVCFSPDAQKLYFESWSGIYQYNLSLSNVNQIISSRVLLQASTSVIRGTLKLGPDGKVYFQGAKIVNGIPIVSSSNTLSTINYPDKVGTTCSLEENIISLLPATSIRLGLPSELPILIKDTFYTVRIISAKCFANAKLHVRAVNDSTGWDYQWNTGATTTTLTPDAPGTYWITFRTPPCNFHTDTFHVSFPNGVLPDITIDTACINSANGRAYASTYPGDTVTYHYTWNNATGHTLSLRDTLQNVPSGNYTLRVTTAHCDTTLSFYIPEVDYRVSFQADSIICEGKELQFINTSDSSFTRFYWGFGDQGDSRLRDPDHIYQYTGSYEVTLIGQGKICTDTANKTITVDSLFPGTFLIQPDSICAGQEAVSFYPQTDSSALSLHWNFGDGTEMASNNEEKVQHAYETVGIMPVKIQARFRVCPDTSFTDTVYVYAVPKINLGPDTSLCENGAPIILSNLQALPAESDHYRWSTGDTTKSLKIIHPGIYGLTINNEPLNCSNQATIKITKDCYIDIPNAFTPNGDGANDYFFPRQLLTQKVAQFKMQVFNRWGELIFETTNASGRGWDGKLNGKTQPQGAYIYLVDADFANGRTEHYEGSVTLLR